jgi:hypothetical protein
MPLPALDNLRVASPCPARWKNMRGDDRVRLCEACGKNVYNLAAMTRDEATQVITQAEQRPCIRLYQRKDGTALTSDCPEGRASRRHTVAYLSACVIAVLAIAFALLGAAVESPFWLGDSWRAFRELFFGRTAVMGAVVMETPVTARPPNGGPRKQLRDFGDPERTPEH